MSASVRRLSGFPKARKNRCIRIYRDVGAKAGFWAEVPALPGCYSQGETIDELMVNVREAIAGVLEVMNEQGQRPEPNIQVLDVAV